MCNLKKESSPFFVVASLETLLSLVYLSVSVERLLFFLSFCSFWGGGGGGQCLILELFSYVKSILLTLCMLTH